MRTSRQKTLWFSIVLSAFGPGVLLVALWMNTSTTQLADFIRRTAELSVLILALWTYQKLAKAKDEKKKQQYQRTIYVASGLILWLSSLVLAFFLTLNLLRPVYPEGNVLLGLSVAGLGVIVNAVFALRYARFHRETPHAVMDSQKKLYQAKTMVDLNVMIALLTVLWTSNLMVRYWVDNAGTLLILVYLFYRGSDLLKQASKYHDKHTRPKDT